jgi:hypothetical protein
MRKQMIIDSAKWKSFQSMGKDLIDVMDKLGPKNRSIMDQQSRLGLLEYEALNGRESPSGTGTMPLGGRKDT